MAARVAQGSKSTHARSSREPLRARTSSLQGLHFLDVAVGSTHIIAVLGCDDPGLIPLPWRLLFHADFPPADIRGYACFPLSSQRHYVSFGSSLGFPLLQNWRGGVWLFF